MTEPVASYVIPRAGGSHSDYIVYVDESGDHSLTSINPRYPLFVLSFCVALLHKARPRRHSPDPRRSYAIAIVSGVPSSVKRLSNATRTCSSVTWRSNVRAITRSPSRLKQCILVSTKLRRW